MPTDLEEMIRITPLCDTHEHLAKENRWVEEGPDILVDLFDNYVSADLATAGASREALNRLLDTSDPDIAGRFEGIRTAWGATRFTGYGEAVRTIARELYQMEEITGEALAQAQDRTSALRQPGERYRILHDRANLDHVQVDDFCWPCAPDHSGLDFFFYDLSWISFCSGEANPDDLLRETGIEPIDLPSFRRAQEAVFEKYAPYAVAVKAQHAYRRTLNWHPRSDDDAGRALQRVLAGRASEEDRLCLGDWSWAHGVELSIRHNLPFKIHTGYYAGNWGMVVDRIHTGQLYRLLQEYPEARFVLMHIAYPYSEELTAMAKHYPNVWVDLCWAWSIDPYTAGQFVRRFLHAVPNNKLLAFGGDTSWPGAALAYSRQARQGLHRALAGEIEAGDLTEREALEVTDRLMQRNARSLFDLDGLRARLKEAAAVAR